VVAATAVFAPAVNGRRETVTVIRTDLGPIATNYTPEFLSRLLLDSQAGLANARISPVASLTTVRGLVGFRIEVDYVPPGRAEHYQRVHAVFSNGGTALISVLYTAASPEAELSVFQHVVDTLHEES